MKDKLDVAISTWGAEGMRRVAAMNLPHAEGVRYVVSWQNAGADRTLPDELARRDDIRVCFTDERGLGANRLNANMHCDADYILVADDDVQYSAEQLGRIISTLDNNPDVQVALFRYQGCSKAYPAQQCDISYPMPKGYYVSSIEIAFRREILDTINFDSNFGINAPLFQAGEDSKFIYDAITNGMRCRFFPITICSHEHPSTGDRPMSLGMAYTAGKLIRLEYPGSWILRIPLKAWRNHKIGGKFFSPMLSMFHGAFVRI